MQIESGDTAPGVPDTHLLLNDTNITCWLELKVEKNKPKKVDLRRTQVPWLRKYGRAGGKCFVVLNIESSSEVYVWEGSFAKELYDGKNIFNLPHMVFHVGGRGGWKLFLNCLKEEIVKYY